MCPVRSTDVRSTATPIAITQACVACGYDTAGLANDGVCPECGVAVAESLRGNLLRFADPAYLQIVVRGTHLLGIAIVLVAVTVGASILMLFVGPFGWGGYLVFMVAPITLCWAFGWWRMSFPDPRESMLGGGQPLGLWTRLGAGVLAGAVLISIGLGWVGGSLGTSLAYGVMVLACAGQFGLFIAGTALARRLAARIPDESLGQRLRSGWWLPFVFVAFGGLRLLPPNTFPGQKLMEVVALIALLVLIVRYMWAILSLRQILKRALEQAVLAKVIAEKLDASKSADTAEEA